MKMMIYNAQTKKELCIEAVEIKYPITPPPVPSETELLQAEIADLKARLAKVEAVPLVKTALEPIVKDPILTR